MKDIIFYADTGSQVGFGHLSRCTVLAQHFQEMGAKVGFVADDEASRIFLAKRGLSTVSETSTEAGQLIVVDSYKWHDCDFRRYQKLAGFLLVIDDLADRKISCDAYLNHNLFAQDLNLSKISANKHYLGKEYALISKDFDEIARKKKSHIRDICICLGGSDQGQYSLPLVKAMHNLALTCPIKIISPTPISAVSENDDTGVVEVIVGKNLASILSQQSFLVCGAGQTSLEALSANIPFLPVVLAPNQKPNAMALAKLGIEVLVDFDPLKIADKCKKMINNDLMHMPQRKVESKLFELVNDCMGSLT